jgi:cleavage and polyadenylation specificity factor subunit 4
MDTAELLDEAPDLEVLADDLAPPPPAGSASKEAAAEAKDDAAQDDGAPPAPAAADAAAADAPQPAEARGDAASAEAAESQKGWPSRRLPAGTRYFVIKAHSPRDVKLSMQKNIWATQRMNEAKLNEAYEGAPAVVLFFSANESRAFQGYARMASKTGEAEETWTSESQVCISRDLR